MPADGSARMKQLIPLLRRCWVFARAVVRFSGRHGLHAAILVGLGALLEGFGILLLVPLLGLLFDARAGTAGSVTGFLVRLFPPEASPIERLVILLLLFAALMLVRGFVLWRRDALLGRLQVRFVEHQRVMLARLLGAARWPMLARIGHGRVTHLMGGDVQRIGAGAQYLVQGVVALVVLVAQLAVAFMISPALASFATALMLIGALGMSSLLQKSSDVGHAVTQANLAVINAVARFLGGIKVAISQNSQHEFVQHFERELTSSAKEQAGYFEQQALLRALWSLLGAAIGGVTILIGFGFLHLPAPMLIAVLVVLARTGSPAAQIHLGLQQIAYSLSIWDAVRAMEQELAHAASPRARAGPAAWPPGPISVERVAFRHPGADPEKENCLVEVSFTIERGEIVGLSGASGAGKTSLADLLCGLLSPQSGRIMIGGVALSEENAPGWRDHIAYVAQDPVLFNESVRDNLLWANGSSEDAMEAALTLTGADRVVGRLPQGLDTLLGERGTLISGGERQRLALARALLRGPDFLILDEATSAIDVAGETEILLRLRALRPRPAMLIIAHRPETLRSCDRVLHLANGRLIDEAFTALPDSARPVGATVRLRTVE